MQKHKTLISGLKLFCLSGVALFQLACGGGQASDQIPIQKSAQQPKQRSISSRKLLQPGMHVYKDPVTGEFVAQPPTGNKSTIRVQPQSLQQTNSPDTATEPAPDRAQEYESPTTGGGILLDLPAPYSETQE